MPKDLNGVVKTVVLSARKSFDHGCEHLLDPREIDATPLGRDGIVVDPLPQLRAGDLGGGRIFHQIVDGGSTHTAQP